MERLDSPAATRMAEHYGLPASSFLRYWTLLESVAKIEDVPAAILLRRHPPASGTNGLAASYPAVRFTTGVVGNLVFTVAWPAV
jgi:hypothetical protein